MSSPAVALPECAQQDAVYKRAESQQRRRVGLLRRHRLSQFKVAAKTVAALIC